MMKRRLLIAAAPLAILAGCATGGSSAAQFDQAKAWLDAGAVAIMAAAQQYLAGPPAPPAAAAATVQQALAALQQAKTAVDALTVPADWKSGAVEVLALIQQLSPIVAPYLGGAAPYVPLAIAVVTAFVQSLPAPANAPATPPAALTRKAAQFSRR